MWDWIVWLSDQVTALWDGIQSSYNAVIAWVRPTLDNLSAWVREEVNRARSWVDELRANLTNLLYYIRDEAMRRVEWVRSEIYSYANARLEDLRRFIDGLRYSLEDGINRGLENLRRFAEGVGGEIRAWVDGALGEVWRTLEGFRHAWESGLSELRNVVNAFTGGDLKTWVERWSVWKKDLSDFMERPAEYILARIRKNFLRWVVDLLADFLEGKNP